MKALISVDMEGMPYIVSRGHLNLKAPLYDEGRRITTKVTLIVAEELHKNSFDEVIVADSHGPMTNLYIDDLPEYVEIIRGFPRPLSMVSGIEECDAAIFLGYHAKFGTAKSTFDHTYSGASINKVTVNGIAASEFLLNAYVGGESNVPVILVAGEAQLLKDDVKKYAPWCEAVILKHSLSRVSARSPSMIKIEKELRTAVKKATTNFKKHKCKPLKTEKPVRFGVTFQACHFADVAELLPRAKRLSGLEIEYTAKDMIEAYKTFELLALAASAMSTVLANQT